MVKNFRVPDVEYVEKINQRHSMNGSQQVIFAKASEANKSWLTVYVVHENIPIVYLVAPSIKYIYSYYW